jgi:hypothetical protein
VYFIGDHLETYINCALVMSLRPWQLLVVRSSCAILAVVAESLDTIYSAPSILDSECHGENSE